MFDNFTQFSFNRSGFQPIGPLQKTLVPGAAAVEVATFDITPLQRWVTISFKVTVAALSGIEVWMRGDPSGDWFQLTLDQIHSYGRTDPSADVSTTPAGVSGFITVLTSGRSDVQLRAKSTGAAVLSITAGGQ